VYECLGLCVFYLHLYLSLLFFIYSSSLFIGISVSESHTIKEIILNYNNITGARTWGIYVGSECRGGMSTRSNVIEGCGSGTCMWSVCCGEKGEERKKEGGVGRIKVLVSVLF
jgi:hypothetical protein